MESGEFWDQFEGTVMVTIIWSVWVLHQLIILVVMLNFLIAIISESYESVMSKSEIFKYNQRAQLNVECLQILHYLKLLGGLNCLTVVSQDGKDSEWGEWLGFVASIKHFIKVSMRAQRDNFNEQIDTIKEEIKATKDEITATKDEINLNINQKIESMELRLLKAIEK